MAITYEQALQIIAKDKTWGGTRPMAWPATQSRAKNNWPKPHQMRNSLLSDEASIEGCFVDCYYKRSPNAGIPDKVSFSLVSHDQRILGIDDGPPSIHRNKVGVGLPFYGKAVGHPHLHAPTHDAVNGYATPIDRATIAELWTRFLAESNISLAPDFESPESTQTELPL